MNNILDLVNSWAQRLTYRVLQMSGASDVALSNYKTAIESKNSDIIQFDDELKNKVPWIQILIIGGTGIIIFLILRQIRLIVDKRGRK
jgi:hypothetical protein